MTTTEAPTSVADLTAAQWRLLNGADTGGRAVRGDVLMFLQQAEPEDITELAERALVRGTRPGGAGQVNLTEFVPRHRSGKDFAVKVAHAGLRLLRGPENTLIYELHGLGSRGADFAKAIRTLGGEFGLLVAMAEAGLLTVIDERRGPVDAAATSTTPVAVTKTYRVLLAAKGRARIHTS